MLQPPISICARKKHYKKNFLCYIGAHRESLATQGLVSEIFCSRFELTIASTYGSTSYNLVELTRMINNNKPRRFYIDRHKVLQMHEIQSHYI
jgi:hypothetical protein